jgi:hypothetical protein
LTCLFLDFQKFAIDDPKLEAPEGKIYSKFLTLLVKNPAAEVIFKTACRAYMR